MFELYLCIVVVSDTIEIIFGDFHACVYNIRVYEPFGLLGRYIRWWKVRNFLFDLGPERESQF